MIDINRLHQFIDLICDKWQNFTFDSEQKDLAINAAQIEYFTYLDGNPSQYQPGSPLPVVGFEQNEVISNELEPFIRTADLPVQADGKLTQTSLTSLLSQYKIHRVTNFIGADWKRKDRISGLLKSSIVAPDSENPIFTNYADFYQFYPKLAITIPAVFLAYPKDVKWNYTVVNNRPVYSAGNSVQCEFKAASFLRLVFRALVFLGLNITYDQLISAASTLKSE